MWHSDELNKAVHIPIRAGGIPAAAQRLWQPARALGARVGVTTAGLLLLDTLPAVAAAIIEQACLSTWVRGATPPMRLHFHHHDG